ncbi:unnamed protein product [Peniophora sp. CBMAI 1063]|nr:unnamed protein product [Peniophora sp. CBMAI 1063]
MSNTTRLTTAGGTGESVFELGFERAARADIVAQLCTLRKPQAHLDDRFVFPAPRNAKFQPPLMHYGVVLSKQELLRCVKRLGITPRVHDFSGIVGVVVDPSYDPTQNYGYERDCRQQLLLYLYEQPEIHKLATSFEFKECFVPDDGGLVLSLYTNYSRAKKIWSVERKRRAAEAKFAEVVFPDLDSEPCFKWYWDKKACGIGCVQVSNAAPSILFVL